jgi:hypothetical protein
MESIGVCGATLGLSYSNLRRSFSASNSFFSRLASRSADCILSVVMFCLPPKRFSNGSWFRVLGAFLAFIFIAFSYNSNCKLKIYPNKKLKLNSDQAGY